MKATLRAIAFAISLLPTASLADQWIPYTDGRAGGCWLSQSAALYGCTPQPSVSPRQSPADKERMLLLRKQNQQLRSQLQEQQNSKEAAREREIQEQHAAVLQQRQAADRANQASVQALLNESVEEQSRQNYQEYRSSMEGCPDFYAELAKEKQIVRSKDGNFCFVNRHGKISAENCPPCPGR